MGFSLKCLLDKVPGSREVLPYLAALERALAADGTTVLDMIPPRSLRRMGAQLSALPVAADDLPLRALQVQLMAAVERRSSAMTLPLLAPTPPRPAIARNPYLPSSLDDGRVEVKEISVSEWAAASELALHGPGRSR